MIVRSILIAHLVVAVAAIDGLVTTGLERNLSGSTAAVADHFVHLTLATIGIAAIVTTGSTAGGAATGFILETLLSVERLFGSRESEFLAAFGASQGLVLIH